MYDFLAETRNYSIFLAFIASSFRVTEESGSLKRIDYPKQICLAHPLSFECFHCSKRNSSLYFYLRLFIFSTAILSLPVISVQQLSVSAERMCTEYWLTAEDEPAEEKCV